MRLGRTCIAWGRIQAHCGDVGHVHALLMEVAMRHSSMLLLLTLAVHGSAGASDSGAALPRADTVDVPRFMGDWYVIAHIPTRPERKAYDAVERYALRPDGRIQTTFTFRKGSFQAPLKSMHPIGQVAKEGNGALWSMQFLWPFKAEYVIAWRDADYAQTIVARSKRDYVWYMARTPQVSDADYQQAVQRIAAMGYDVSQLRRVPQSPR
ncbi:apolipoprotein D and lipocalin family protein [Xanthomonas campestris]|nr:apolipoprotein D and lipocalin family protein [Xanthomonas sp. 3075]